MPIKDLYYQKYLKYKNKYLNLHNQIGGSPHMVVHQAPDQSSRSNSSSLPPTSRPTSQSTSRPTTSFNDIKINKELEKLNKNKELLDPDVFFDEKHRLHMLMDKRPESATQHDLTKKLINNSYYYIDRKKGGRYRVLPTGQRSYLKDEWDKQEGDLRAEYIQLEKKKENDVKLIIGSQLEQKLNLEIRHLMEKLEVTNQNLKEELRLKLEEQLRPKLEEQLRHKLEEQLQRELEEQLQLELEKQVESKMSEMRKKVEAEESRLREKYEELLIKYLNEEVGSEIDVLYDEFNDKLRKLWQKQRAEGRTDRLS